MSTGDVDTGGTVLGATVVGAEVSGGTLVGGGEVVVVLVVVVVVVVLAISGGSPSGAIGVTPSLAGRLHAPSTADMAQAARTCWRLRLLMLPPLANGRRSARRRPGDPRPTPPRRARWRARRRAPGRVRFRSGAAPRCRARSARRSCCARWRRRRVRNPRPPSAPNA